MKTEKIAATVEKELGTTGLLLVQSREYSEPFANTLDHSGIAHEEEQVGQAPNGAAYRYRYKSPTFGMVYAYEIVIQYDVDGFYQTIITSREMLKDESVAGLRRIEKAWTEIQLQEYRTKGGQP